MPSKTLHALIMFSATACMAASAQNCALPPGTVGIGKYCTKDSSTITIAQSAPNTVLPAAASAASVKAVSATDALESSTKAGRTAPPATDSTPATATQAASVSAPALRVRTPGTTIRTWTILPTDGRLATTFERWAKADGMKLVWDAQQHVMLSSSDSFTGTLTEALNRVMTSPAIRLSPYPLEACIYPNNPPLLRITRAGEQSLECPQ